MARQVLPIAGAVIGGAIGGPMGAQIGFALGSVLGNAIDPQVIKGPSLGDAGLQTSAEGVFRPIVYGTGAVKGNVIVRGNRQVKTQRTQQGKGGGPVTEQQRVYWDFGIRICEAPVGGIAGILRIWQDEKLVYDVRPGSPIPEESAEFASRFRLYLGDEAQLPDPDLEAWMGVGNVPAYRGSAWIMFPHFDLTDRRESIPDFRFEVAASGEVTIAGRWFYGPVTQNGPAGGSSLYYMTADHPLDLPSQTPTAVPAWMANFARISTAGDAIFLHANADNGAVSLDRGANWTQTSVISANDNVFYDGDFYYCLSQRSADAITWEPIPNYPAGADATAARPGALVATQEDVTPGFYVSVNQGASWDFRAAVSGWVPSPYIVPLDSGRFLFTVDSTRGRYTDDLFQNQPQDAFAGQIQRSFKGEGNASYGRSITTDDTILRSVDGGVNLEEILSISGGFGPVGDNILAEGDGILAIIEQVGGSPQQNILHVSTDQGENFTISSTLYGNGGFLAFGGGGTSGIGTPVTLGSIVSDLHLRAGHTATDFDVSELTDEVQGLVLAGDYTCADAIRTLMPVYFFDAAEYDSGTGYKIHHVKRGKPVVLTVTVDDLIDAPEKTVREDALERPKKVHLHYENPTIGYAPAKATSTRDSTDVRVVGETSVQVPVSFIDVDEPARISSKIQKVIWTEVAGETTLTVSDHLLELVPTDCIGLSLRGQTTRQRITQDQIEGGALRWRLLADRQSAYTSNVTGVPVPEPTPPLPSIVGPTQFEFLDIPALNDGNDSLIWYEGASGQTEAWYGAQTQRKAGAMVEFENSATFNQNTIMGILIDDVPSASEHYTDTTNTVRVQLYMENDVIESLTQAQFLSEGGAFALEKSTGGWEVLQYRDAVDEGSGIFSLSYLARGRLASGASEHLVGGSFVLLDGVQSVDSVTAWINTDITSRAVSFGTSPETATQYVNTYTAKSQTEFPVAHLFLERNVDTIEAMTVPRHRFGTELNPVQSINWIGYRWTATDGTNTATIPDGTSPTISFDATGWSSPITVTVAQINRFTGPGPSVSEQIA